MSNYLDGILSGQSGYSKTTAAFTQPSVGNNVTVFVGNAGWAIAGVAVNIATGGSYQVVSVPSLTQLTLKNLGGSTNAAPASTVPTAQVIAPGGTPGQQGSPGTPMPVTVMIDVDVPNLAAGPTAFAGYTLLNGDAVCFRNQTTTPANNGPATFATGGIYTLSVAPPDNTTIVTLKGATPYQTFYYKAGVVSVLNAATVGTLKGANTITTYAPDALGLSDVVNEGVPRTVIATGGAWVTVWQCDPVARGLTTGRLVVTADLLIYDGPAGTSALVKGIFNCAAATLACQKTADITDDGAGPYIDAQLAVVGGVFCVQLKNLTGANYTAVGIAAYYRGKS